MNARLIKWGVFFGLLLAAAAGLAILAARGRESDESWQNAKRAIADHDFPDAQRQLVDYVTHWRKDSLAHLVLARCYRRAPSADFESASGQIQQAQDLGGHRAYRQFESDLLAFQRLGRPPELEEQISGYLESRAEDAPLVFEALARGAIIDRRLDAANKWLDRWISEYPGDWWARLWRGTLLQHMDRPRLAVADYRFVLERRGDDPEMAKRLGLVLAVSGIDYEEAERLLADYLSDRSDDVDALAALARCQRAGGRPEEALGTADEVLEIDSRHADALLTKALSELELKSPQAALKTVRQLKQVARESSSDRAQHRLLALQPLMQQSALTQHAEAILQLEARVLSRVGREDEARERLEELPAMQRVGVELKKLLARQRDQQDDADLIYQILERYLEIDRPMEAEVWLRRLELVNASDSRISAATDAIRNRQ